MHRHVCSVTAVCVSVRPRQSPPPPPPRNGLVRPVPVLVFPPRRTPPPPAADAVNREIYAERRAAAAAESRNTPQFRTNITWAGLHVAIFLPAFPNHYLVYIYRISSVYLQYIYCCVRTLVCMARCEKGGVTVKTTCQYYTGEEGGTRRSGPVRQPRARRGRLCYIRFVA